jgi:hypothetical protein
MPKKITPKVVRKYIDADGSHCPYCGHTDISAGKLDADGGTAWSMVECKNCGREWQDIYLLRCIEPDPSNGKWVLPTPDARANAKPDH